MSTYVARGTPQQGTNYYYRPAQGYTQPAPPPRPQADVRDDFERWYTEPVPNNRMSLSVRSGVHSEISWALDRLCRLAHNEHFAYKSYPGLIDGLFDWPEWYVTEGYKQLSDVGSLFSPPPEFVTQHRYALESLFILRNGALQEANARELQGHSHTLSLILNGLTNLDFRRDENQEALLYIIEIFQTLASNLLVSETVPDVSNPILPLSRIVALSNNRSLIIAGFTALTGVLSHPGNSFHFTRTGMSLGAAIRYLPLFMDKQLLEPCLEHIYVHVAHPATARAFLLNRDLPSVLRVLCSLILAEQQATEERITLDITPQYQTVNLSSGVTARNYTPTQEELEKLANVAEPQRCYDWMRLVLSPKNGSEMTQVDIWNMYKETFTPYQEPVALLGASDVIKYVTHVFPTAQAMVLQAPQRFIVKGIERRQEIIPNERFKCRWDRSTCSTPAFTSPSELFEHIIEHLNALHNAPFECLWVNCTHKCNELQHLRTHLLTHMPTSQPLQAHPSQSDTITITPNTYDITTAPPTHRPLPPPRNATLTFQRPVVDPSSAALTALLIIRVLFRTAFASSEAAPKADADHFGFPGIVEDTSDPAGGDAGATTELDKEGERRGRRAFVGVRNMLANIRLKDDALMAWVTEMVDSTLPDLQLDDD